jgi:hypothetical protein
MTAGAWLPLAQAGGTGVIVFALVLSLGLMWRWRSPVQIGGVIGLLAFGFTWFGLGRHWLRLTLGDVERFTGLDLNRDGMLGRPDSDFSPLSQKQEIRVVVSEVTNDGHLRSGQYLDLPCTADQLLELARGLIEENESFTERSWCGADRPFSVAGFRELRGEFISRGLVSLASSKDTRQGYTLTLAGRHVLAGILEELTQG